MNQLDILKFVFRLLLIAGTLSLALAACSSDPGNSEPPPANDGGRHIGSLVAGVPDNSGSTWQLSFEIQEDYALNGAFYDPTMQSSGVASLQSLPAHGTLTLQYDKLGFLYQPQVDYNGFDSFTYTTQDGSAVTVRLDIRPVDDPPVLSSNVPRVAEQGRLYLASLDAVDPDGGELSYSAAGLPRWLSLNSRTAILSGTPTQSDIGFIENISFRVTDSTGLFDELSGVVLEVIDINDAPTLNLSQFPDSLDARESLSVRVFPDDPDGDKVTLATEPNAFLTTRVSGGTIFLQASDVNDVTEVNLVIEATDLLGRTSREILPLTIYPLTESGRGRTLSGSKQGRGVDLVILGDGYRQDQQTLFYEHVESLIYNLHLDSGIARHLDAFNIHMISTVSADSGADDNELVDSRDTAFDSVYNCSSVPRLICANTLSLFEASLIDYPAVDQIILLINDRRYGGSGNSGGSVAITSAYAPEIALHEMGHSLADLADEYVDTLILETSGNLPFVEGRYRNVTAIKDPQRVPWSHWIDDVSMLPQQPGMQGVGLFEGGLYRPTGVYRPTFDSRMRSFDAPFGPVNSEQWILRLYTLTEGIRGFAPLVDSLELAAGESKTFTVSPFFSDDVQSVEWRLDNRLLPVGDEVNSIVITPTAGRHTLALTVTDISGAIRIPPPHAGIFTWNWELNVQ